jgi:hypothetical protein
MVDIDQAAQPIKVQQQAVGGGNVIEGMSSADDLDRSTGLRCSGDQSDKIIDGVRMGDVARCGAEVARPVRPSCDGRPAHPNGFRSRGSRSTMAKGGAALRHRQVGRDSLQPLRHHAHPP